MSRNEAQTRFDLVDPALETRGWLRSDIRIEVTAGQIDIIDGKPHRRLAGRTDYILRRPLAGNGEPIPLAIIEVKVAACRHAVEGQSLYRHPDVKFGELQLIVVADFAGAPQDSADMVAGIFRESEVRLVTSDALPALKQEIVSHAKLAPLE
jgi:hypothetical protein